MKVRAKIPLFKPSVPTPVEDLRPGMLADDGSIYLGLHGGLDWYVVNSDAKGSDGKKIRGSFNDAAQYAKTLKEHGRHDWALPPGKNDSGGAPDILNEMHKHQETGAFKGTYDPVFYWSSSSRISWDRLFVEVQHFRVGEQSATLLEDSTGWIQARCVRSERRKP